MRRKFMKTLTDEEAKLEMELDNIKDDIEDLIVEKANERRSEEISSILDIEVLIEDLDEYRERLDNILSCTDKDEIRDELGGIFSKKEIKDILS